VPDVVGLKEADAKGQITAAGCASGKITRAYSSKRPKGRVLAQKPGAAFLVDPGTKVNLTISKGKAPKRKPHSRGR
jgi:serine/threonine-protein kinase